jgi:hypothetical protein
VPVKKNYCRLCWLQAALQAASPPVVTEADLAGVTHHQLAFAGTTKMRGPRSGTHRRAPRQPPTASPEPTGVSRAADGGQLQLHLPGPRRAFDRAAHAEPTNPALVRMRQIAQVMSQAQGWNTTLVAELDRALVVLLSGHADDQQLRYSQRRCCVVAWWAGWGAAVLGSNSGGEFGEAVRDPVPRINVGAKFVVAAVEVLNEGVPGLSQS